MGADKTPIEWTDRTWNPTRGCRRCSPGCANCYAERVAYRFSGQGKPYEGLVRLGKTGPVWTGEGRFVPDALDAPLRWRKPQRVFVNSMSDLFFEEFSFEEIAAVFGVMAAAPRHTFQVLTKRAARAAAFFEWLAKEGEALGAGPLDRCLIAARNFVEVSDSGHPAWPLRNVWIGASVEDQQRARERLPHLLKIPAAVRFVSYEPALEAVDFRPYLLPAPCQHARLSADTGETFMCSCPRRPGIEWLIVGGESGPGARPFDLAWARKAVADCKAAGVPVFVKQMGAVWARQARRASQGPENPYGDKLDPKGGDPAEWPADLREVREFPEVLRG